MGFFDRFRTSPDPAPDPGPPAAVRPQVSGAFSSLRESALGGADLELQRSMLVDGMAKHGVSAETISAALEYVRDGVVLLELGDATRSSRIGGPPLLPPEAEWPRDRDGRPLTFIASFDLGELPSLEPLPPGGTLLVFWSERFHEFERMDFRVATRVFWVPEDAAAPVVVSSPDGVVAYDPVPLTGVLMPVAGEFEHITVSDEDAEALYGAEEDLLSVYDHQLLGSSRDVQGPVLDEVSYWFNEGYPETTDDFTEAELAGEGWTLLAQIESTGELMFGDAGALYVVIPKDDLRARRFDRALGIMQCS